MHFIVSHQIRSPLCRIQGLTNHIDSLTITKEELESLSNHLKTSVTELDSFTFTLTEHLEKVRVQNTDEETNTNYYS
jgi:K+-sensing histidine kinase KdpD